MAEIHTIAHRYYTGFEYALISLIEINEELFLSASSYGVFKAEPLTSNKGYKLWLLANKHYLFNRITNESEFLEDMLNINMKWFNDRINGGSRLGEFKTILKNVTVE